MRLRQKWRPVRLHWHRALRSFRLGRAGFWIPATAVVLLILTSRLLVAYYLANDDPGDGVVYARLASNLLQHDVYSLDTAAPFSPTLVRLPGYPLFLAGVYSMFGVENNTAVRCVQAVVDTGTCVIAALIAALWLPAGRRRFHGVLWTLIFAGLCPFVVIYAATILTETLTAFLMAAMTLAATLAFRSDTRRAFIWWGVAGMLAGISVMMRPDSGLFAAGLGLTIVVSRIYLEKSDTGLLHRLGGVISRGAVFSLFFVLALVPWTVRNYRVFGVVQPLAPAHAEMPGEFVPYGYFHWLRTWVDDSRFIEPMLWDLNEKPILMSKLPGWAFDTPDERQRVAELIKQYNNPPGSHNPPLQDEDAETDESQAAPDDAADGDQPDDAADEQSNDDGETSDDQPDEEATYEVRMTPELATAFGQIADERAQGAPLRTYLFVPAKRAAAMWFDSHSLYYPFGGQMSPIADLDVDEHQEYWLPAFTLLTWLYSGLGLAGIVLLWRGRSNPDLLRWLILLALMTLPRIMFFATIENPEPRYVVELFVFTALLGGLWLGFPRHVVEREVNESSPSRLLSLDVFRGLAIVSMILVDEPGTWSAIYPQLQHAAWNGATFADLVFPAFLFTTGVSIAFSLGQQIGVWSPLFKVVRRALVLFGLGLLLEVFPFYDLWTGAWFAPANTRIMGVLQRIAICYLVSAVIFLRTRWRAQLILLICLLLGYWVVMTIVPIPGCDVASVSDKLCNLSAYIDRLTLTPAHIWSQSQVFDPEGLLSTLPAIASTLSGVLCGTWLRSEREPVQKAKPMAVVGAGLTLTGLAWSLIFPMNKSLWTSSFVLYTSGISLSALAILYGLIDIKGYRRIFTPFLVLGCNAIALYVGSTLFGKLLSVVEVPVTEDATISLHERIFDSIFAPLASPMTASLLFSVVFVLLWFGIMWLLYRKRIFIKV